MLLRSHLAIESFETVNTIKLPKRPERQPTKTEPFRFLAESYKLSGAKKLKAKKQKHCTNVLLG